MRPSYPARHALDNFSPRWVSSSSSSELWPHRSLLWSGQWSQRGWLWEFLRRVLEFLDGVAWGKIQALPSSGYLKNSCELLRRRSLPWGSTFFHAPTNPAWVCLRLKDASKFYCHICLSGKWGFEPSDFRACLRQKTILSINHWCLRRQNACPDTASKAQDPSWLSEWSPRWDTWGALCHTMSGKWVVMGNPQDTMRTISNLWWLRPSLGWSLKNPTRDLPRENTISQQRVLLLLQAL